MSEFSSVSDILSKLQSIHGIENNLTPQEYQQQRIDWYNQSAGNLNEKDGYNCDICKNKGFIAKLNEKGYEVNVICRCQKIRATLKRAKRSGLGDIITDFTFDKYKDTEDWQTTIKNTAKAFCEDDKAKWFYIGGQVGCVDCDTEYFNGVEWVKISDYKDGEKVLQYNPETKIATLTIPKRYINAPVKELYHLTGERHYIDMCLSANHDFAYITSKGNMQKKPFLEVMQMHNDTVQGFYGKVETAFNYSGNGINLTENEIRLMCAVIADGSFRKDVKLCFVNVKKERKKERMRMLLSGMQYKEYKKPNGYSEFRFYAPRREKEFTDFWYNSNHEQLKIIVDEVFEWDGSKNGKRRVFFSTSKKSADFIQFAISATGNRATIGIDNHKNKPCYVVSKSSYSSAVSMCSTGGKNKAEIKKVIPKDGKQYCFTVDTGYLVLRRNGRIFITGNCGKTHICTAISAHYIKAGQEVKYMLWCEESKKLKSLVNDVSYQSEIGIYKNVDVLYIDDFLKVQNGEAPTKGDINVAFEILNHRLLDNDKVTIISSEKLLDELMQYDEATMSRIYQKTGRYKLNVERNTDKNYRLKEWN